MAESKIEQFKEEVVKPFKEKADSYKQAISSIVIAGNTLTGISDVNSMGKLVSMKGGNSLSLGVILGQFLHQNRDEPMMKIAMKLYEELPNTPD